MKVAVIKIGSRISFNAADTSGGNGEARAIIKMLDIGGASVHIYTKILKKDNLVEPYVWHNLSDDFDTCLRSYDALIVLNGNLNFFGGAEDPEQLKNYQIINQFPGKVFYILCDPALTLAQVWPSVQKKEWGSKWSEHDLNIVRNDIICLSQPHDVDKVLGAIKKNEVLPAAIEHFPFERFPCLNAPLSFNPSPTTDLSYGGTIRNGRRARKMVKFYFDHPADISVEMFGKIKLDDFDQKLLAGINQYPTFSGPVMYNEMLSKMNQSMAHCVIGDPWYEKINDIPQRLYESIWSGVVTFIDSDMDANRRVLAADKTLSDFLYVSSRQELTEKLQAIKADPSLRQQILDDQFAAVGFNDRDYCTSFVNQIDVCRSDRFLLAHSRK